MPLLAIVLAQDLGPRPTAPVRAPDQPGDCAAKVGAPAGAVRDCAAVSVPPSYLAFLEEQREYAGQLDLRLTATEVVAAVEAKNAASQIEWRDDELQASLELRQPRPVLEVVAYMVLGGTFVVAGGFALGQITR